MLLRVILDVYRKDHMKHLTVPQQQLTEPSFNYLMMRRVSTLLVCHHQTKYVQHKFTLEQATKDYRGSRGMI